MTVKGTSPFCWRSFNAATMMPGARAPHLALARLAREQGDRGEMTARLDRALAAPVDATDLDPFLRYHSVQGRHASVWLDEARDASRRTAP